MLRLQLSPVGSHRELIYFLHEEESAFRDPSAYMYSSPRAFLLIVSCFMTILMASSSASANAISFSSWNLLTLVSYSKNFISTFNFATFTATFSLLDITKDLDAFKELETLVFWETLDFGSLFPLPNRIMLFQTLSIVWSPWESLILCSVYFLSHRSKSWYMSSSSWRPPITTHYTLEELH